MTSLQTWLNKPRATVRLDATLPWTAWMKILRRPFGGRHADRHPRIEVLDRISLGGKKSLLLIAIEGRRLLVGVGETTAPSIAAFDEVRRVASPRLPAHTARQITRRRMVR
jgi:flagellar biogenesis protein FliO